MKTEAHRNWTLGISNQRRFQGEPVAAKNRLQLNAVPKREDGKKITCGPLEAGLYKIPPRCGHYPREKRPRHAVHRKPMLVEMEKSRRHIEHNLLPQNTISWRGKAV